MAVLPCLRPLLTILLSFLAAPIFAITLSPEKPVSAAQFGPARASLSVHAASNGSDFLIVWPDSGAARVTAAGAVLDIPSLLLPKGDYLMGVDVTWDGSEYVVVWAQYPYQDLDPPGLHLSTVSSNGEVRPVSLLIPTSRMRPFAKIRIAAIGDVIAAAYQLYPEGSDVVEVTLFKRSGEVIRTFQVKSSVIRDLVTNGKKFALAGDKAVTIFAPDGDVVQTVTFPDAVPLDVASNGDGFAVISAAKTLDLVRIDSNGSLRSRSTITEHPHRYYYAAVAEAGGEILVAWKKEGQDLGPGVGSNVDLWTTRFTSTGDFLATELLRAGAHRTVSFSFATPPEVATNGSSALVLWMGDDYAGPIHAIPISGPTHGQEVIVSTKANDQSLEAVATSDTHSIIVFSELSSLRAVVVGDDDEVTHQTLLESNFPESGWAEAAYDGEATVIIWRDGSNGIKGARVGADGGVIGEPFRVATGSEVYLARLECAGGLCIVGWADMWNRYVARIQRGVPLDGNGVIIQEVVTGIASDGEDFLVVTAKLSNGGAILSAAALDSNSPSLSLVHREFSVGGGAAVEWDGENYVAFWNAVGGIRASRITRDAVSLDGERTGWQGALVVPDVGLRSVTTAGHRFLLLTDREVVALSPSQLAIEDRLPVDGMAALLAGRTDGTALFAYSRRVADPANFQALRVYYRSVYAGGRRRAVSR
jgi:hypothetical protein